MDDKKVEWDFSALKPVNILDKYGVTPDQIKVLTANPVVPSYVYDGIQREQRRIDEQMERLGEEIEENRDAFIAKLAHATAEENAKAMRTAPMMFDQVIGALASLSGNPMYNASASEDQMNDYVRDILGHDVEVRDQTRQGISGSSENSQNGQAGEIDIQIRHNGKPICVYEGLKLRNVTTDEIFSHIAKATVKYNPQGVKDVFVVAYVVEQDRTFGAFWTRFLTKVKDYVPEDAEYSITWDAVETDTTMSAIRVIHGVYQMDGLDHNVYVIATKILA